MGDYLTVVEAYVVSEEDQNMTEERLSEGTFVAALKGGIGSRGRIQMSKNRTPDKRMLCLQVL